MATITDTDMIAIFAGSRGTRNRGLGPMVEGAGGIQRHAGRENMGVSVMVHGPQGRGKSSACEDVLERMGLEIEVFQAGLQSPETFQGLGWMTEYTGVDGQEHPGYEFRPNTRLGRACGLGKAIQIDDWLTAAKAVQVAAMGLFLDRRLQDLNFGDTPIVGTTNNDIATTVAQMNPANANRMGHVIWSGDDADAYDESDGEVQLTISLAKMAELTQRNPDGTFTDESNALYRQLKQKAAIYVSNYKKNLENFAPDSTTGELGVYDKVPKNFSNPKAYAFASNRTYTLLTCVLATGLHLDLDLDSLGMLVASTIGEPRVEGMLDVLSHRNIPSLAEFFAGQVKFSDHDISEVVAVLSLAAKNFMTKEEAEVLHATSKEFYETYPHQADLLGPIVLIVGKRVKETASQASAQGRKALGTHVLKAAEAFKEEFSKSLGMNQAREL